MLLKINRVFGNGKKTLLSIQASLHKAWADLTQLTNAESKGSVLLNLCKKYKVG